MPFGRGSFLSLGRENLMEDMVTSSIISDPIIILAIRRIDPDQERIIDLIYSIDIERCKAEAEIISLFLLKPKLKAADNSLTCREASLRIGVL